MAETLRWLLPFARAHTFQAENLYLGQQLEVYIQRGLEPRWIDSAEHLALILLSRRFDWRGEIADYKLVGPIYRVLPARQGALPRY